MLLKLLLSVFNKTQKTPGHESTNLIHSLSSAEEKGEYNLGADFPCLLFKRLLNY